MYRLLATVLVVATALAAGEARAQSATCTALRAELAALSDTIGATADARKFSKAIATQTFEIRKLKGERRRLRCGQGSITFVGSDRETECERYDTALTRMQANLDALKAKRARLLDPEDTSRHRDNLIDEIALNGCNETVDMPVIEVSAEPVPAMDIANAENETIRRPDSEFLNMTLVDLGGAGQGGWLKTVCVRTCDGGFFPISNHATPGNFERDAQVCSMMCPGTETELFYQALTDDDTARMTSAVSGRRYGDLDTAFRYRTTDRKKPGSCGCNLQAFYREMMRREKAAEAALNGTPVPAARTEMSWVKPALRDSLGADKAAPLPASSAPVERPFTPDPKIRKIGPAFLPDEADQIDFAAGITR